MFRERELAKQAYQDYLQARGTSHKQLLIQACVPLQSQQADLEKQIGFIESQLMDLQRTHATNLGRIVTRQLIEEHLSELPGIGATLRKSLLRDVFHNSLSDLHFSTQVSGIGEAKQQEIDAWIRQHEKQIPGILNGNFPGKSGLMASFTAEQTNLQAKIEGLRTQLDKCRALSYQVDSELAWLSAVGAADFSATMLERPSGNPSGNKEIDRYVAGVFGAWEQMPVWFQEVLKLAGTEETNGGPGQNAESVSAGYGSLNLVILVAVIIVILSVLAALQ